MAPTGPGFDELFQQHYQELVRLLTTLTGSHEDACDSVQEAFIAASSRWADLQHYDHPAAWVRRVAINRSRDLHRSETRRRVREQLVSLETATAVDHHADPVDQSATAHQALDELLTPLTPRQRSVARLVYGRDLTLDEAAIRLGIATGTVKFHLSRARSALRRNLDRPA